MNSQFELSLLCFDANEEKEEAKMIETKWRYYVRLWKDFVQVQIQPKTNMAGLFWKSCSFWKPYAYQQALETGKSNRVCLFMRKIWDEEFFQIIFCQGEDACIVCLLYNFFGANMILIHLKMFRLSNLWLVM